MFSGFNIKKYHTKFSIVIALVFFVGLTSHTNTASAANYLLVEDFEDGVANHGTCVGTCPKVSTDRARSGNRSLKASLNPTNSSSARMEFGALFEKGGEYWIGFSTYFDQGFTPQFGQSTLWAFGPTSGTHFVPLLLQYHLGSKTNPNAELEELHNELSQERKQLFRLTSIPFQTKKWIDWVIKLKVDTCENGRAEIWRNGTKVLNFEGATISVSSISPLDLVLGMYRDAKNNLYSKPNINRVTYYDELRVTDSSGSYADVAPPGARAAFDPGVAVTGPKGDVSCFDYTPAEIPPDNDIEVPVDIDFTGGGTSIKTATLNLSKPAGATNGNLTLTVTDGDRGNEGVMWINNRSVRVLFGRAADPANNNATKKFHFTIPATSFIDGGNTIIFRHRSGDGFAVEDVKVSF